MTTAADTAGSTSANRTAFLVLSALSLCHFLNDMMQSLLPAIYPVLQQNFALSFTQIGVLHLAFQVTASLLQPAVGFYTDRRQRFRLLSVGMGCTLVGLLLLASAQHYIFLLFAACAVGLGSSIFHPDASRLARSASGGRFGLAQSIFQVGGNTGTAVGPLLAAYVVLPLGQPGIAWFSAVALLGMLILWWVGSWAKRQHLQARRTSTEASRTLPLPRRRILFAIAVLAMLIFSKYVYLSSLTSYYTFYLIDTFGVTIRHSQILLFVFLGAAAVGTILGGPLADRIGRRPVIWISILGVLPFTLMLPHANLFWTGVLSVVIGLVLASAFSAIVVYAQELVPGRVGLISGLFFGFAFGMGGLGAAILGVLADAYGIGFVYQLCAFLPFLGLLTALLPRESQLRAA
ncbi:MFS transporter [Fodinicurvata sediminis]|uniref:MFS transporter n=1 Tax=Fodinicurvata sediminis TaxID=1121832 RepID=UPI0003B34959|nr:MFS transporter [Fodinicurvata sediminis]